MTNTSSTARLNAGSLLFDGAVKPDSLRTNCSDAARTSSSVAGGSKLNSVLMLLHMPQFLAWKQRHWALAQPDADVHVFVHVNVSIFVFPLSNRAAPSTRSARPTGT